MPFPPHPATSSPPSLQPSDGLWFEKKETPKLCSFRACGTFGAGMRIVPSPRGLVYLEVLSGRRSHPIRGSRGAGSAWGTGGLPRAPVTTKRATLHYTARLKGRVVVNSTAACGNHSEAVPYAFLLEDFPSLGPAPLFGCFFLTL